MKHTLNAILHLPSAISADLKARAEKRRRIRIFRKMQNSTATHDQQFYCLSEQAIETGNHASVLPIKAGE
ncbi:hypothetical protein [uncultured Tolumonas sp.]|uniref:hypothetical protein n=1 Tax=uncultured Tolumonas sp. TaxID=263765 RepID=UPI002A0A30C7|nr:hypothetical protein [uncultured Tolumonas sp.]